MKTVQSKYTNPDKYIQVLKNRIEQMEKWRRKDNEIMQRERGQRWFTYKEGTYEGALNLSLSQINKVRIGQRVKLCAEVVKMQKNGSGYEAIFDLGEVRIIPEESNV